LTPAHIPFFQTAPGAGPRHFTFAPGGKQAYVANELNSTVTSFEYQPDQLILKELQTLSTLPAGFTGENTCADVHVHPGGKFVYVSNRGHDSIAVFGIKKGTDKLELIQNQPALGRTPRNFTITRDGQFLLAANQNSDNIVVFRVDPMTGMLAETGQGIAVPKPVCIRMAED